jgi:crotonobetaine/carnitine-CoA ligase
MIFDEHDQPVPEGTVGQIVLRPRHPDIMFDGYWKRPDATAAVWKNMWMHTGDLGKFVDGYLFFADRAKDYLRSRGENISSFEVESSFLAHHAIAEIAVHAVGPQSVEDEIKVTAVLREGALLTEQELCLWSLDKLPHFAVPRFIEFRKELPKNPTGRILKYQLRDEGCTPATWDREAAGITVRRRK